MSTNVEIMNGLPGQAPPKFIETCDPEDPQYRRDLQRPADVKEDMRQMESRQRVSSILNSQAFREELESIIADQLKHGPHPSSLLALQQISELLLPNTNSRHQQGRANVTETSGSNVLIPINDIRGIDTLNYAKGERILRCKLASLYRVIDLYGWTSGISNHISVRLNQDLDQYLVNPYGLLYHEVTASSLVKVNSTGVVCEQGSTTYGVNKPSFSLHSAIYKARPDLRCVIHAHTHTVTAVSSMKCGLLPISQEAILCGGISYHEFKGLSTEDDIKKLLEKDMGPLNKVMFLRNHGVVACGETIEEACFNLFNVLAACEIQSKALVGGLDNIIIPSSEVQKSISDMASTQNETLTVNENKKWKIGELEFEALMRCLDNAGYRTGYMYRQPIMRTIDRNAVKEIEIPPAAQSHSYDIEYVRKLKEEKSKVIKGEWLNSPNNYARTEIEETGTPNPKKITKWIPENSPSKTSTPIRIESKNQFAPQGMDPKELKNNIKQIKQDRFDDKKGPGYTSKILIGIPGDENGGESQQQTSPGSTGAQQMPGDYISTNNSSIVYGAASKGIIKRDQQNNAGVYKTYYNAANPFQQMDSVDLEKYKKEVAQKQIREQGDDRANKSEITGDSKKKSHTIPRSKSMLDKKHEKLSDQIKSNSGISDQSSSEESMLDKSKQTNSANTSTPLVAINMNTPGGGQGTQQSKSATMGAQTSSEKSKADKPKKKSKLSFLSRKKKDSSGQV